MPGNSGTEHDLRNGERNKTIHKTNRLYQEKLFAARLLEKCARLYLIRLSVQGNKALFDPQFQDAENDSLSFQLVSCFATGYRMPSGVSIHDHGIVSFSKDSLGLYAFSFMVTEWRKDGNLNYQNRGSSQSDLVMNITTDVFLEETELLVTKIFPNPTTSILHILDKQNTTKPALTRKICEAISRNFQTYSRT